MERKYISEETESDGKKEKCANYKKDSREEG